MYIISMPFFVLHLLQIMWTCTCCQTRNNPNDKQCQLCWQSQTQQTQQPKPVISRVQVGTKRTRPKLYDRLVPPQYKDKATEYLEYLEAESWFQFLNKLCKMKEPEREAYLEEMFDDLEIANLEDSVYANK